MAQHDAQMLKGVLALLLLSLLATEDGYGYSIVTRLKAAGFPELAEGTVYPALTRLENAGHLESYLVRSGSGPARKYYRITATGRQELADRTRSWHELSTAVATITSHPSDTTTPQGVSA
ncbi:MAG: PadR family transcriptional regulator [Micrococcales bacterium]|nr:PadR family transcriptional regulator [Micrococcales bacterium]